MRPLSKQRSAGFTLWEMMGCLALLAVVAAILFPVFAKTPGHHHHRSSICQHNLKQIGMALNMYIQDYGDTYPTNRATSGAADLSPQCLTVADPNNPPADASVNFVDGLSIYIARNPRADVASVWKCPDVKGFGINGSKTLPGHGDNRVTYGMNYALHGTIEGPARNPSATMAFRELGVHIQSNAVAITSGKAKPTRIFLGDPDDWYRNAPGYTARAHGLRTHVLFVDGHVEAFQTFALTRNNVVNNNPARPGAWCLQDATGAARIWLTP